MVPVSSSLVQSSILQKSINHQSIINKSSSNHQSIINYSLINHQSIINQSSINHYSIINQPFINHQSIINPSSINGLVWSSLVWHVFVLVVRISAYQTTNWLTDQPPKNRAFLISFFEQGGQLKSGVWQFVSHPRKSTCILTKQDLNLNLILYYYLFPLRGHYGYIQILTYYIGYFWVS